MTVYTVYPRGTDESQLTKFSGDTSEEAELPADTTTSLAWLLDRIVGGQPIDHAARELLTRAGTTGDDPLERTAIAGWRAGVNDAAAHLRTFWHDEELGRFVWAAWYAGMVTQARPVSVVRRSWEALPERDRALDRAIATILAERLALVLDNLANSPRDSLYEDDEADDGEPYGTGEEWEEGPITAGNFTGNAEDYFRRDPVSVYNTDPEARARIVRDFEPPRKEIRIDGMTDPIFSRPLSYVEIAEQLAASREYGDRERANAQTFWDELCAARAELRTLADTPGEVARLRELAEAAKREAELATKKAEAATQQGETVAIQALEWREQLTALQAELATIDAERAALVRAVAEAEADSLKLAKRLYKAGVRADAAEQELARRTGGTGETIPAPPQPGEIELAEEDAQRRADESGEPVQLGTRMYLPSRYASPAGLAALNRSLAARNAGEEAEEVDAPAPAL